MDKGKRDTARKETGRFLIDSAKLVFGGVVLAGVMDLDTNRGLLLLSGVAAVLILYFAGLNLVTLSKGKDKEETD